MYVWEKDWSRNTENAKIQAETDIRIYRETEPQCRAARAAEVHRRIYRGKDKKEKDRKIPCGQAGRQVVASERAHGI